MGEYVKPEWKKSPFTCPHCGTVAQMHWDVLVSYFRPTSPNAFKDHVFVARCYVCNKPSIWTDERMVYPLLRGIEPHEDMPEETKKLFNEAQDVIGLSPRSSCALLRLCLEQLVEDLGGEGKNLNDRITSLELPPDFQPVFDACRLAGNQAAHPGVIDFSEPQGAELARTLSDFINLIAAYKISPLVKARAVLKEIDEAKQVGSQPGKH